MGHKLNDGSSLRARETVQDFLRPQSHTRKTLPLPERGDVVHDDSVRCMDCGTPFCHSGCPTHNLTSDWIARAHAGKWDEALDMLHATTNFPEFTGRVCPAPCEAACVLDLQNAPVGIRKIETAIINRAWREGRVTPQPAQTQTGKRIAIIGSGPAGLACAQQLSRVGHHVEVFDKNQRPGGLLRYGIPDFRLKKRHIDRRIHQMMAEGVVFHTGKHIGIDLPVHHLLNVFDATVLSCGAEHARTLDVDGSTLKGVHLAMDYLTQHNKTHSGEWPIRKHSINAQGKHVAVIGGGQTGIDCICTANREGAASITQIDHNPSPNEDQNRFMTWPDKRSRFFVAPCHADEAQCENLWAVQTQKLSGSFDKVQTLHYATVDIKYHKDGSRTFIKRPHGRGTLKADLVLLAMGFAHATHTGLIEQLGLTLDERGNAKTSQDTFATNIPTVYACGDMRSGQSLVVNAIQEGRSCAYAVDRDLMGQSQLPR